MSEEKTEEETYSLIFKTLKHPIRRKILRILVNEQLGFSEIQNVLSIDSGHLSYHIDNLGDLVRHSESGKYELSSIGKAAVNLMSGVEERPQMVAQTGRLKSRRIREILIGAVLIILVVSLALNVYHNNLLQLSSRMNSAASREIAADFQTSVARATYIPYLITHYREGFREDRPTESNIDALISGFLYEMEHAYFSLRKLMILNPEQSVYEKPLYVVNTFIMYVAEVESFAGRPTVRVVLTQLIAESTSTANYTIPLTAFNELSQTSFGKINEVSFEVAESFTTPLNTTRLDNTIKLIEQTQIILGIWVEKYS